MQKLITKLNKKQNGIFNFCVSLILFLSFLLSPVSSTKAAINKQINYQGKLTTSSGVAVPNGTYNMEFKLYNSVPAVVWTETRINANRVQVTNGLFSVMLGEVTSLSSVDFNQTLTLGVNIGGTAVTPTWDGEMTPRKTLGSVPAAILAETVTGNTQSNITSLGTLTGLTVTGALTSSGGIINLNNNSNFAVNIGTGTSTGAITIGGGTATQTVAINSSDWDIGTNGSMTGISGITNDGSYTQTGTSANTFTGASTFTGGATIRGLTVDNATATHDRIAITAAATGAARFDGIITNADLTASRTWTLPNNGGTIALTSDIPSVTGFIPYTGATSNVNLGVHNLTVDTNSLFVDSTNHMVGVGTTSPVSKLHTVFSSSGEGSLVQYASNTTNASTGLFFKVSSDTTSSYRKGAILFERSATGSGIGAMHFALNNTADSSSASVSNTRMSILEGGNIGIGTTNPSQKLEISGGVLKIGSGDAYNAAIIQDGNGNISFRGIRGNNVYWSGTTGQATAFQVGAAGDNIVFTTASSTIAPRFMAHTQGFQVNGGTYNAATTPSGLFEVTNGATKLFDILSDGNVGIGVANPIAKFHVHDGSLLVSGTMGSTPYVGSGTRLMWIPSKMAFRAGVVSGDKWDDANIGTASTAIGSDTMASAQGATAMGEGTTASGQGSVAMGLATTASGSYSVSMGSFSNASGYGSVALGEGLNSSSYSSTSFGRYNVGGGDPSSWVETDPLFELGMGVDDLNRANALTILKNGNVGIGTAIPTSALDITKLLSLGESKNMLSFNHDSQWGLKLVQNFSAFDNIQYDLIQNDSGTEKNVMTFSHGNVGIGTTSPVASLDVVQATQGNIALRAGISGSPNIIVGTTTGYTKYEIANGGYNHSFFTRTGVGATSERFRIEGGATIDDVLVMNSNFGVNTNQFYVQQSTGNIGIGTTPNSRLHAVDGTVSELKFNSGASNLTPTLAVGNTAANGKFASLVAGTNGAAFIYDEAGYFNIRSAAKSDYTNNTIGASGTDRMRILSNGNVGIGTTNPGALLHVNIDNTEGTPTFSNTSVVFQRSASAASDNRVSILAGTAGKARLTFGDKDSQEAGTLYWDNALNSFVIPNGNVGIGTASPNDSLVVSKTVASNTGQLWFGGGSGRVISAYNNGSLSNIDFYANSTYFDSALVLAPQKTFSLYNYGGTDQDYVQMLVSNSDKLLFNVNGSERLSIDSTGKVSVGGTDATSTSKLYISGSATTNGSSSAIAGILGGYTFTNGGAASYVQVGNRFVVTNNPTTNPNTAVGEMIRVVDNTSLANTVRGLDVTANGGSGVAGINTGIRGSGATFGIQGVTTALAGGTVVPAAIYGENTGTGQGDILRLYSNTMTTAPSFATFFHNSSTFSGTGLLMDFAAGSGSFTGDFINLQKNSTSMFKVTNAGIVSMGLSSTAATTAVCSSLANGTSPVAGTAYEIRDCSNTPVADYAEMYPVESGADYGDIVVTGDEIVETYDKGNDGAVDWSKIKGNISKLVRSSSPYQQTVIGIVSDNYSDFSSVGYNIKKEDNPKPVALNGRVPVKVASTSSPIKRGDYLTTSLEPGRATRALKSGFAIGKALEDWDPASGKEMIMVFVEQGYYDGGEYNETTFNGLTFFEGDAEFTKNVVFGGKVEFSLPPLFNNDTAGFAVVKQGARKVDVIFDNPYISQPIVSTTISFEDSEGNSMTDEQADEFFNEGVSYIITNKTQNGFTIRINKIASKDIRFSWTALSVKDPKVFESVIDGLVIEETPSETVHAEEPVKSEEIPASSSEPSTDAIIPTAEPSSLSSTSSAEPSSLTSDTSPMDTEGDSSNTGDISSPSISDTQPVSPDVIQ